MPEIGIDMPLVEHYVGIELITGETAERTA
jgi:hypothetical protein